MNLIDLDRAAVLASTGLAREIDQADLGRTTPCAGWDLRQLLAHMSVQHRGFAAAAAGRGADPRVWAYPDAPADPVADYLASAEQVLAAFAAPNVLDAEFALPEISAALEFPGRQAISFHFLDYVVHSWDVARTLGSDLDLAPEVAAAALRIAQAVPAGAAREVPGAAFAPALSTAAATTTIDQVMALLGRSPSWPD